jgi:anti-sigma B factor antagonist
VKRPYISRIPAGASCWIVRLEGDHDVSAATALQNAIDEMLTPGTRLVVDLAAARFIDSSILGVLVNAHRRADSSARDPAFAVVAPPGTAAASLFDLVGAREFIPTFDSCGEAIERLPASA